MRLLLLDTHSTTAWLCLSIAAATALVGAGSSSSSSSSSNAGEHTWEHDLDLIVRFRQDCSLEPPVGTSLHLHHRLDICLTVEGRLVQLFPNLQHPQGRGSGHHVPARQD